MTSPKTPISGTVSYCSAAEFLSRVDPRPISDWVSKDGTTIGTLTLAGAVTSQLTLALASDPVVAAALQDASGMLESCALRGGKYTTGDLTALTAEGSNGGGLVKRVVSGLALGLIGGHRIINEPASQNMADAAEAFLEKLENGERMLPFQETAEAGRIEQQQLDADEIIEQNLLTWRAHRSYGNR